MDTLGKPKGPRGRQQPGEGMGPPAIFTLDGKKLHPLCSAFTKAQLG